MGKNLHERKERFKNASPLQKSNSKHQRRINSHKKLIRKLIFNATVQNIKIRNLEKVIDLATKQGKLSRTEFKYLLKSKQEIAREFASSQDSELPEEAVKGLISACEDVKEGRYYILTNEVLNDENTMEAINEHKGMNGDYSDYTPANELVASNANQIQKNSQEKELSGKEVKLKPSADNSTLDTHDAKDGCGKEKIIRVSGRWLSCGDKESNDSQITYCNKCAKKIRAEDVLEEKK